MTEPIFTFRIYANSLYFKVFIWPTKKAMYKAIPCVRRSYTAICRAFDIISAAGRKRPIMGEIHFVVNSITSEIVDHEFMHAALAWGRRVKLDWHSISCDEEAKASVDEERLCEVHWHFVDQFLRQGFGDKQALRQRRKRDM